MTKKKMWILVGILMPLVCSLFCSNDLFAMDKASMKSKAAFRGVYNCIINGAYRADWMASAGGTSFIDSAASSKDLVKMPYGLSDAADNSIDCKQIMIGFFDNVRNDDGINNGLIPKNIRDSSDPKTISDYFSNLGYKSTGVDRVTGQTQKQQLIIKPKDESCYNQNGELVKSEIVLANGNKLDSLIFPTIVKKEDGNWYMGDTLAANSGVNVPTSGASFSFGICSNWLTLVDNSTNSSISYELNDGGNPVSLIVSNGGEYTGINENLLNAVGLTGKIESGIIEDSDKDDFKDYSMKWLSNSLLMLKGLNANNNAGYSLPKLDTLDDLKFTDQEVYDLYVYYARDVFEATIVCEGEENYDAYKDMPEIKWSKGKKCKYDKNKVTIPSFPVYGVKKRDNYFDSEEIKSMEDLADRLGVLDLSKLDTETGGTGSASSRNGKEDKTEQEEIEETCRNATGAKSLGWIVCPLLSLMGDATEKVYNEYVEPSLQVKPELFGGDESGNNSVREAWEKFRDIANIVFIILLMVVIFSQLTGIGIDNYGIKKILPRLIVAAILINLSYLICMIMVDLSNILGNGLREMFNALGSGLNPKVDLSVENAEVGPDGSAFDASTTLAGLGVFGVLVGAVGAIWVSPAILLSLLISGIGVMVSVFFLFILLAARKAAIIVLVTISPLAVVMYMLPNTKSLSNKWWKFFEGLLLVYPIAGLLVGAGDYVSRLLLSNSDGFFTWITAMVVGVVPIFFIPMVLKSSFAAMGKVGGILTGLGAGASKRATGAVRGSEAYKNLQNRSMERQTRIKAGVNAEGKSTRLSRTVGTVLSGGRKNAAGYRAQYLKNQDANRRAEDLMGVGYDAAVIAQSKRAEADEMGNYMTLINSETRNGENEGGLFKMFDDYMASGNKAGAVAVARIAGRRKDTAASFMQNMMDNAGNYDDSMLQSIAKEVSTGENSGNYRASNPFGFEFASQINKGTAGTNNYTQWIAQGSNAHNVLDNYVTNTQELVGMKGGSLNEMSRLMSEGVIGGSDAARISNLATQAIEGRDNPGSPWDSTKAGALANLSGQYSYDASTDTLTRLDGGGGSSSASPSPSPSPSPSTSGSSANANNSSHAGTFNIDHGGSHERVEARSGIVLPNARDNAIYGGNTRNVRPDAVIKATNSERGSSQSSTIITGSNANQAFRNRNNR